jgi:hypothetical protein
MDDPRLANVRVQDDAVRVGEASQSAPDAFDRNAEPLGDLARVRNAPGRQQRLHVPIVDRGLDVASHASSSQAAAATEDALIALSSSAVVRISCA